MTTKNKDTKAMTTNTDTKAITTTLPGDYDLVAAAGKMGWAQLKDDPKPFDPKLYADQTQPMENVIEGVLLSKDDLEPDAKTGEVRSYYRIQLVRPCITEEGKGANKVVGQSDIGEVVAIGERMKLEPLDALLATGNTYRVLIHAAGKIEVGKGNTMWTFNIGKVLIKSAAPYTPPQSEQASA